MSWPSELPPPAGLDGLTSVLSSFASAFQQSTRILKVRFASDSGIPENLFLPHRLTGEEAINAGMRFELEALSSDAHLELKTILGVPVEITVLTDAGSEREICGVVTEIRQEGSDGGFGTYRLVVESGLAVLRHRVTARVFNQIDVRALTARIIGEHLQKNTVLASCFTLDDRCRAEYPVRPFWMQYNESDEAYLKRIWAREGISFVLEPGKASSADHPQHTLVLFDDAYDLDPDASNTARFHRADGTEEADAITAWEGHRAIQSGSLSRHVWDHDTATSSVVEESGASNQGDHGQALAATLTDYRNVPHLEGDTAERHAELTRRRMQARDGLTKQFEGEGSVRTFRAGSWFTLTQHPVHDQDPEQDRAFVITALQVQAVNNLPKDLHAGLLGKALTGGPEKASERPYTNRFTSVRRGVPILAEEIAPPIPGLLTARVVGTGGDVHTDALGRIKIRFLFTRPLHGPRPSGFASGKVALRSCSGLTREAEHTDAGASETDADSTWVRQAEAWSSQGFGANFVPRVGDEVVVQFLGDDPDKPLVTGCVYNGVKPPASFSKASALPLDKTLSGFRSQMHSGLTGSELILDDTTNELRARLATDHEKTALSLGHLVHPRTGGVAEPKGEGFELRTDAWGAVRAEKGLLISTDARGGAASHHADPKELTEQTTASLELTKALSDFSQNHQAHALSVKDATEALKQTADAKKPHAHKDAQEHVAAFDKSILGLSSPAGIVEGTPGTIVKSTGKHFQVTTGQDTNLAVGRKLVMAIQDMWSVVAKGIKLFAGKGDIAIQAHEGSINLNAEKDLHLVACNQGIDMAAPNKIVLTAGGASFELSGDSMLAKCTRMNIKAKYNVVMPKPKAPELPSLVKEGDTFDHFFYLDDENTGEPMPDVYYKLTKGSGEVLTGYTDAEGRTCRISAQEAAAASVEFFTNRKRASK